MCSVLLQYLSIWILMFFIIISSQQTIHIVTIIQRSKWSDLDIVNQTYDYDDLRISEHIEDVDSSNLQDFLAKVCKTNNVHAYILYVECKIASVLERMLIFHHIPTIVISMDLCDVESEHLFLLHSSCFLSNAMIADIAAHKKWTNVIVYYDEIFNSRCLTDMIRKLSLNPTSTRFVNIDMYSNSDRYLKFASKYQPHGVIFLSSIDTIENTVKQAETIGFLHLPWVVLTGTKSLPKFGIKSFHYNDILYLRSINESYDDELCMNDATREEQHHIRKEATMFLAKIFSDALKDVNMSSLEELSCNTMTSVPNRRKVIEIAKEIAVRKDTRGKTFEMCSLSSKTVNAWQHSGKWSPTTKLKPKTENIFNNVFVDFGNSTIKVAAVEMAPYVVFNTDKRTNKTTYTGFCIDILNQLAQSFKFNYDIVSPADNGYGSLRPDGTWNGMIGMVLAKEADMAAGPFTITAIRGKVVDFTKPYYEEGVGILTKRPQTEKNKEYKMFKPLSIEVWVVTGIIVMVIGVLLYIVNRFSPYSTNDEDPPNAYIKGSLASSMWLIYGSFVEQGAEEPRPKSLSGRVMLSFWWVFTILMLSTYTANLAAYLTVTIIESPINSLDELANQNEIRPLIFPGSNLHTLFQTSKSKSRQIIWEQMADMPEVNKIDEVLRYVRQGKFAFLTDYSYVEYLMLQDCLTFAMADDKFNNAGLGYVLPKNSKFLQAFDYAIMKMTEGGFIERWRQKWWPRSDTCSTSERSSSAQALGLDSLSGLFYMYLGVIGVSLVLFVLELIARTKRGRSFVESMQNKINKIKRKRKASDVEAKK